MIRFANSSNFVISKMTSGRRASVLVTVCSIVSIFLLFQTGASQNLSGEHVDGTHQLRTNGTVIVLELNSIRMNHSTTFNKTRLSSGCILCCNNISIYKCHLGSQSEENATNKISFAITNEEPKRKKSGCMCISEAGNCHVQNHAQQQRNDMEALCKIIACLLYEMSDPYSRVVQEWKNFQYDNSMNCKLTHCDFYQEDSIQQINVKEVHTREQAAMEDCTNVVDSINQAEMTNRKNSDEKTEQFTPTIVTGGKVARTLEVHIQFNQIPTILAQRWLEFQKKCNQPEAMLKGSSYVDRVMPKPSIFKEVHLPYMSRLLIERKRHTSSWKPWKKKLKLNSSSNKIAAIKTDIGKLRHKREMHIMMARYREEIKGSRKTKRKTSTSRPSSNGNKNMSVPHSILNVSFTGSWDPPPKTTVKPRVGRPLKMTPEDMEFVHGKKPEKKRQRGGLKIVLETS